MNIIISAMAVLAAGGLAALFLSRWTRWALAAGLASIVVAGGLCVIAGVSAGLGAAVAPSGPAWTLPVGGVTLAVDALSGWFLAGVGILSVAVAVYSWGYLQDEIGHGPVAVHAALLCLLVLSLILVLCAADAVLFLVGWELMSLSAFFLISFHDRRDEVRKAAWMYLIATHLGTAMGVFPLLALLIWRSGGVTSFAAFPSAMAAAPGALGVVLFVLGLIGFGAKAGFIPGHVWLPVAHPAAPSPVSAMMSGIVIKTGIYGLLRLLSWLPALPISCALVMLVIGAAGGILGILQALSQRQLKRLLAYSSVENIGIIALGIGIGMLGRSMNQPVMAVLGFAGAMLHVLNHSLFKGLLFLSAGAVLHSTGTADLEQLGGLGKKAPVNAALFLLGAGAICALPPLNGFVSEWLIYNAMFRGAASRPILASAASLVGILALAIIGALALASFAKAFGVVFLGAARNPNIKLHPTPRSMLAGMMIPATGCVVIGMMPWLITPMLRAATGSLVTLPGEAAESIAQAMRPLVLISAMAVVFVLMVLALWLLRTRFCAGYRTGSIQPTWGCGYARPTARMQYTGSSFAWSLMSSFQEPLQTRRDVVRPEGVFPAGGTLSTQTPDVALTRGFEPLFEAVARQFQRLWPLQHGRIQLYLVYIAVTLMAVFLVEVFCPPYWTPRPATQTPPGMTEREHRAHLPSHRTGGAEPT
jgi:hydrogenase-4 component B